MRSQGKKEGKWYTKCSEEKSVGWLDCNSVLPLIRHAGDTGDACLQRLKFKRGGRAARKDEELDLNSDCQEGSVRRCLGISVKRNNIETGHFILKLGGMVLDTGDSGWTRGLYFMPEVSPDFLWGI